MDAVASLPPYAHVTQEAVQCAAQASSRYDVPELLLHAILRKENGRLGSAVRNKNGTLDLGPAQINSVWLKEFGRYGLRAEHLRDNFCINLYASAYILRTYYNAKGGDWFKAVVSYNIGPNRWTPTRYAIGYRYATDVVKYWWEFHNWVAANSASRTSSSVQASKLPAPAATGSTKSSSAGTPAQVFDVSQQRP